MAIRNLTNWNDPLFRKVSKPVTNFPVYLPLENTLSAADSFPLRENRLWTLLDDMRDTLERVKGYRCAAVHVGILRRVVVVLDKNGVIELVNPIILETSTKTELVLEGSIAPDAPRRYVERPDKVTVSAFDRFGNPVTVTGEGFLAATFCHEIDHLNGILFTDKATELLR